MCSYGTVCLYSWLETCQGYAYGWERYSDEAVVSSDYGRTGDISCGSAGWCTADDQADLYFGRDYGGRAGGRRSERYGR